MLFYSDVPVKRKWKKNGLKKEEKKHWRLETTSAESIVINGPKKKKAADSVVKIIFVCLYVCLSVHCILLHVY